VEKAIKAIVYVPLKGKSRTIFDRSEKVYLINPISITWAEPRSPAIRIRTTTTTIQDRKSNATVVLAILARVCGLFAVPALTSPFGKGGLRGIFLGLKCPISCSLFHLT
jgi:hypothetical protein